MTSSPEKKPAAPEAETASTHQVAVIGAGLTGLSCARSLLGRGFSPTVFDRGRRPGGRMSTRHVEANGSEEATLSFDLGVPAFEQPVGGFANEVDRWIRQGIAGTWIPTEACWRAGRLEPRTAGGPRIIGQPTMDAIPRHLAEGLSIRSSMTVTGLRRTNDRWMLSVTPWREDEREVGPFDSVVLAMAPPQSVRLLEDTAPDLKSALERIRMSTIWVALLEMDDPGEELPEILHLPEHPELDTLIRESGRTGRVVGPGRSTWVIHARDDWSGERHGTDRTEIAAILEQRTRALLETITGRSMRTTRETVAHRWGLARSVTTLEERCLHDDGLRLAICGDGLGGSDIETCHLGGLAAAECVGRWHPAD